MTDLDLSKYIYWEYSVAVLLMTEVLRALLMVFAVSIAYDFINNRHVGHA